jgi:hypothetical protein
VWDDESKDFGAKLGLSGRKMDGMEREEVSSVCGAVQSLRREAI